MPHPLLNVTHRENCERTPNTRVNSDGGILRLRLCLLLHHTYCNSFHWTAFHQRQYSCIHQIEPKHSVLKNKHLANFGEIQSQVHALLKSSSSHSGTYVAQWQCFSVIMNTVQPPHYFVPCFVLKHSKALTSVEWWEQMSTPIIFLYYIVIALPSTNC